MSQGPILTRVGFPQIYFSFISGTRSLALSSLLHMHPVRNAQSGGSQEPQPDTQAAAAADQHGQMVARVPDKSCVQFARAQRHAVHTVRSAAERRANRRCAGRLAGNDDPIIERSSSGQCQLFDECQSSIGGRGRYYRRIEISTATGPDVAAVIVHVSLSASSAVCM